MSTVATLVRKEEAAFVDVYSISGKCRMRTQALHGTNIDTTRVRGAQCRATHAQYGLALVRPKGRLLEHGAYSLNLINWGDEKMTELCGPGRNMV